MSFEPARPKAALIYIDKESSNSHVKLVYTKSPWALMKEKKSRITGKRFTNERHKSVAKFTRPAVKIQ